MTIAIWNRPAAKARDPKASQPLTEAQVAAQKEFAGKLHKVIQDGINDGSAAAFLTPNKENTTLMVALTVPMEALTVETPNGDTRTTNNFALNVNVAIPEVQAAATTEDEQAEEPQALSYDELMAITRKNRAAKKAAKK